MGHGLAENEAKVLLTPAGVIFVTVVPVTLETYTLPEGSTASRPGLGLEVPSTELTPPVVTLEMLLPL